ncbi:MAG: AgmX/PglI C-terminal domain-containing protein [Deltaproteobacteria bacterium]|nr:AgmX/PglI C-terminal domain-containing protein [Deltaproteobacteria bacterium]
MATARPQQNQQVAAGPRRRILRIGVLLGGKIIEERLVREHTSVSIGQSAKNTFSVAIEALPREWVLFELHGDQYSLRFNNQMDGRLSDGSGVYTFDVLRAGRAKNNGDHWILPLGEHSRGKVTVGDLTLLFQFVTEPPKQPRPMLPASVRGTFADRIDPHLAVTESASMILCFGIWLFAMLHDPSVEQSFGQQAYDRTFKPDTYEAKTFDLPEQVADGTDKVPEKQPDKGQPDKPKPDQPKGGDKGPTGPKTDDKTAGGRDKNDAVALQEQAVAAADGLFSEDETTNGLSGGMDRRKPGTDLGQQMQDVKDSGRKVEVGGGSGRGTRGDGEARTGTGKGPVLNGPNGPVDPNGGKGEEKVPPGRINVSDKQSFDESTLTPDAVLAKIMSAYMSGLKRCHKDLLKTDPVARGKVTLKFTVSESGRVSKASVKGFNDGLDSCIQARVTTWRFAEPKDKDGEGTDADFQITLALQPE